VTLRRDISACAVAFSIRSGTSNWPADRPAATVVNPSSCTGERRISNGFGEPQ
jgi:hypothetical protein